MAAIVGAGALYEAIARPDRPSTAALRAALRMTSAQDDIGSG